MPPVQKHMFRARLRDALIFWLYIPAAVIGGGWGADFLLQLPSPAFPRRPVLGLAAVLLIGGVLLIQKATLDFRRIGGGTPNPQDPPVRLVREGSYALCRHPMYLGYDLAALGTILLFRSWGMLLIAYPLLLIGQIPALKKEETRLERRFGEEYGRYRRRVPFLLPNPFSGRKPL
jgi:protein-S-isoprenylcysteine O-methyltransferase Ste14